MRLPRGSRPRHAVLGLDVGTSATKGVLLDESGRVVANAHRGYALSLPRPGWVELEPELVWDAVAATLGDLSGAARRRGLRTTALAFSVSGDDALPVDERGVPVGPCIMALDVRSAQDGARWATRIGPARLHRITGLPPAAIHPLVRLLWLREHDPGAFERIRRMLGWGEWLALRLGLPAVGDPSLAARTMAWDVGRGAWSDELLAEAGLPASMFPDVAATGSIVGPIPAAVAASLGLDPGTVLVAGGLDQYVAALGAGCAEPADAMVGTGSWEAVTVVTAGPLTGQGLVEGGYAVGPYVVPDRFAAMATSVGGGTLLRWLAGLVAPGAALGRLLREMPRHPTDLLVLPHVEGSYSPWLDAASRGAVLGIGLATTRGELLRGALEGITYELRENLERMAAAGIGCGTLRATGGGARSRAWLQLKADVLGRPIERLRVEETGAIGAACLAGAGAGLFDLAAEAARRTVRPVALIVPRPDVADAYAERFARYQTLYPALRDARRGMSD